MNKYICYCGEEFDEDKLVVKEYDAGYSEGECPSCGSSENWNEAKQCIICGEWYEKDSYAAGCKACNICATENYTPELGREFLVEHCRETEFYLIHLRHFCKGAANSDEAIKIIKAGIQALGTNIDSDLQDFCLVKYHAEWVEFCEEYVFKKNSNATNDIKSQHVA